MIKVLSLNTWNEEGPFRERWELILDGIQRYCPDILAFQELISSEWAIKIAARAGFNEVIGPEHGSGLVIMSPWPIANWESVVFKTKSKFEEYDRAVLFACIHVGGVELSVLNTHLSWRLEDSVVRQHQVMGLISVANEMQGRQPVLAMGDFNATPESPEIGKMAERGDFKDVYGYLYPGDLGYTWDNANPYTAAHGYPDRRLDYIFIRDSKGILGPVTSAEILFKEPNPDGVYASDHYGILATFGGR